jgi:hypothetical protein
MSARPRRRHIIAAAVVIAALVIASSILTSSYLATGKTVTDDVTTTSIQTTTQLSTTTSVRTQTIVAQSNYTITSTITTYSTATITNITIDTVTQNETSTTTETVNNPIPWYGLVYLSAQPGCTVSSGIVSYPCPASSRVDPYVFDCAAAAATPQGCTEQVNITGTTNESFTITIHYPSAGGQPGQNCNYVQILPPPFESEPNNAYCIPINSTSFLISEPDTGPL